jgi:hypothetical protein
MENGDQEARMETQWPVIRLSLWIGENGGLDKIWGVFKAELTDSGWWIDWERREGKGRGIQVGKWYTIYWRAFR